MNLKIIISNTFLRKAFRITLVLLFSLNFFAGAALAKSCEDGAGCLSCAEAMHHHRHLPGMDMARAPHGCQPFEQEDACSSEIGSDTDNFHGIIPTVRTDQNEIGGNFGAIAADESPDQSTGNLLPQPLYSDIQPTTPIYLILQSLLC